jgi:predicted dehydrogenase
MENQTRLRVGLVGCGYQGEILARTILEDDKFQVTACADPDQAAASQIARLVGNIPVYSSVDELLQHSEVDAVMVATSHDALFECSLAAVRAGKHVLAEKPIGLDEKEAAQLEESVAGADVCFMAGYSFRYIPAWQKLYNLTQAGAVGEIHTISAAMSIAPLSSGWKANPDTGGGPMLYVGTHLVDQIL